MRRDPAGLPGAHHATHRRAVRSHLASTRLPPGATGHADQVGVGASPPRLTGDRVRNVFIAGGAGFIGSYFVDRLLSDNEIRRVTVYDNFTSGREWHLEPHVADV